MLEQLRRDLEELSDKEQAKILQGFFKTGKGEYGEGDVFLGIKVPIQRKVAKKYFNLKLSEIQELLNSKIHDHRMVALFILVDKYKKAVKANDKKTQKQIFDFYLSNAKNINNWDLVDLSAPNIVGNFLIDKDRAILYKLARSDALWEKRIAVLATFVFIRNNDFKDSIDIAEILLNDKHDLIHKAVGWMLREIGKRDQAVLLNFLDKYSKTMPRTMLRYTIEKLDEGKRVHYMKK